MKEKEEEADNVLPVDDVTSDELKKKAEKAKVAILILFCLIIFLQQDLYALGVFCKLIQTGELLAIGCCSRHSKTCQD